MCLHSIRWHNESTGAHAKCIFWCTWLCCIRWYNASTGVKTVNGYVALNGTKQSYGVYSYIALDASSSLN